MSRCKYICIGYDEMTDEQKEEYHNMVDEQEKLNDKYGKFIDELKYDNKHGFPKRKTIVTSTEAKLIRELMKLTIIVEKHISKEDK